MGLPHAVFLVQVLHEWLIRRVPAIRRAARPREWGLRPREMYRSLLAGVIVDDLYLLSVKSKEEVDQALAEVEPIYDQHGWVAKESKRGPAALQGRKITGVMVEVVDLALRPPKERLWDVSVASVQLVRKGTVSVAGVDRVMHVLGWYFLLVRPSLSISRDSYRWIEENRGGLAELSPAVIRELLVAAALAISSASRYALWRSVAAWPKRRLKPLLWSQHSRRQST